MDTYIHTIYIHICIWYIYTCMYIYTHVFNNICDNAIEHVIIIVKQKTACRSIIHAATHWNMLQHTETCCNTLKHAATAMMNVCHDSFMCVPWLIHVCHDSSICAPWLIHYTAIMVALQWMSHCILRVMAHYNEWVMAHHNEWVMAYCAVTHSLYC